MRQWGIRRQLIMLALLPVLLVTAILTGYFTYAQLQYIQETLEWHGRSVANQIAPVAEDAVTTGNVRELVTTLRKMLADPDIISIRITNTNQETLISLHNLGQQSQNDSFWNQLLPDSFISFHATITTQEDHFKDFTSEESPTTWESDTDAEVIGYVELVLTSKNSDEKKLQSMGKGALLTLVILFINTLLALRISKQIAQPVQLLTRAVKDISSGHYETRIQEDAPTELGTLEACVNIMAEQLQIARDDMESRIDEFTRELQQTLEELEIRNAELDIARSNAMQANKAKSEFLANMSHEIRTPLGGILGFSELLENTELKQQQKDYAETIRKSATNLLAIIDDVLDLSKIESGKLNISKEEFDILSVIEEVIDLLTPIAYEKNIELFYHLNINTPRLINADIVRIRQILTNLIGNAVKFTEEGYVYLQVELDDTNHEKNGIKFTISDTGIGMDKTHKRTLFDAFTQADTSITRRFGGTGLGLVISRKLTNLMGGTIGFDSTHGEGSTFWFTIPVEQSNKVPAKNLSWLNNKKIALVDDHQLSRKSIKSMLESWGCLVTDYSEKKYAVISSAANHPEYDAQVVSICRTNMHSKKLKSLLLVNMNNKIPTLAIASTRSYEDLKDIRNAGFDDAVFRSSKRSSIQHALSKFFGSTDINELVNNDNTEPENKRDWLKLNILIVDDNDINLKLAEIILAKNGAQIITARSGKQGIEYVKQQPFDLIFMDLQMPGLDGYETTMRIRALEHGKNTIIIALTANAISNDKLRISDCGMDDLLVKPISENLMQDIVNKWLLKNDTLNDEKNATSDLDPLQVFSREEAKELAAGNEVLANELTTMLIAELPTYRLEISNAFENQNKDSLKDQTHKLHGASRCCGTPALRYAADQLENAINNNSTNRLETGVNLLIHEIDRLIDSDPDYLSV